jgi:hypothetical protein
VRIRPVEPGDTAAVGDVFLAALAGMTYLPDLYAGRKAKPDALYGLEALSVAVR